MEEIYTALEGLPAGEREQRLLAIRPLDLAADVRDLFKAIDAEAAAQSRLAADNDRQSLSSAPQLFGYQLLDPLGSGGAGVVYRASRLIDQGSPQPVAVKVFHLHRAGLDDRQRFVRELAIVATLDHPAIVKFFDGGFTADDRPYLVMELVEGVPLTTYCDLHQFNIEDRLRLLLGVIDAIAWAHARLVVHLDLKPSNILVTAHGTPKVLDFGAARLIDDGENLPITQQITPQYASPERLRAEPPTVASDVYSLGLLLFEVLSGGWPFPTRESLVSLAERAAGNSPLSPLPNAAPAGSPLKRQLQGDLDAICAKALAFEAAERYATANDLAEDIRRYLDRKPVRAHPPSLLYRTRKFAMRYWARLAVAAVVVAGLGGAGIYSALQAQKARRAATQAEVAVATLSQLLSESNFGRAIGGRDMTVKELLTAGLARISPARSSDPSVSSDFAVILARGFTAQADYKHARTAVDQALRLADASGDVTRRAAALCEASRVSYHESQPEVAWDEARRAFQLWQAHSGAFSTDRSLNLLADAGFILLHAKLANPAAGEAFSACLRIAPAASQYRTVCLEGLANVGIYSRNAYREGLPMLAEVVALRRADSTNPSALANALQAFGMANRFLRQYAEDEAAQREALALVLAANGAEDLFTANFRAVWASSLLGVGREEASRAEAESALAVYRRFFPQPGANLLWTPLSAAMASACLTGRFADCERYSREALQTLGPKPSEKDNRFISAQGHLGWALARLGHAAEARPMLSHAIEAYQRQNRRPPVMSQLESALQSIAKP